MPRWPFIVTPVVVFGALLLTTAIVGGAHESPAWATILDLTVQAVSLLFLVAALAAICVALAGGEAVGRALLGGSLALLGFTAIHPTTWAVPVAIAVFVLGVLFEPITRRGAPPSPPLP